MGEQRSPSSRPVVIAVIGGAVLIAIGLAVGLGVGLRQSDDDDASSSDTASGNAGGGEQQYKSAHGTYRHAAVVADSKIASQIGKDMMARNRGNAIDAAVAAVLATGLMNAHSCGIGGGSFIIIYDSEGDEWHAVNSRETAPMAATESMFNNSIEDSLTGGRAIAVPGEVIGLYRIHQRLGKLPWSTVVKPSLKLCEDGVPLTAAVYKALGRLTTPEMKQSFAPYFDENGNALPVGSLIKLPKLAATFRIIADDPDSFYNGSLAADIVADINEAGGIFTLEDMRDYNLKWAPPTLLSLPDGHKVYSISPPGSGPVLNYMLSTLAGYNLKPSDVADKSGEILTYHRIVEAFKFAYAKRTELGDEQFVDVDEYVRNMSSLAFGEATRALISDSSTHDTLYYHPSAAITDDHGTTHLSVLDGVGNAVSITSTVNTYFGSKVKGNRTGIVFNNEMNDFSIPGTINFFGLPASPSNFIRPGKRPMSSMSPVIVWDDNRKRVRIVSGASGGTRITSATALNLIDVLWLNRSLVESVDRPRLHHQLIPPYITLENGFPEDIAAGLRAKGHKTNPMKAFSVVQPIAVTDNGIDGVADFRKGGEPDGF